MSLDPRPSDAEILRMAEEREQRRAGFVPFVSVSTEKRARLREKEEQNVIRKMAIAIGFHVYSLSQARATKQTPGLPDLWLVQARALGRPFAGWWEAKRQVGGERSAAQVTFGDECAAAGIPYGYGSRHDFAEWLSLHGFTPPPIPE